MYEVDKQEMLMFILYFVFTFLVYILWQWAVTDVLE